MVKRYLIIFVFSLTALDLFSFGKHGCYYLVGIAHTEDNSALKNSTLAVIVGGSQYTVTTGDYGEYEIEVHWAFGCKPGLYNFFHTLGNPRFVVIKNYDKEIKVRNRWKKYARKAGANSNWYRVEKNLDF